MDDTFMPPLPTEHCPPIPDDNLPPPLPELPPPLQPPLPPVTAPPDSTTLPAMLSLSATGLNQGIGVHKNAFKLGGKRTLPLSDNLPTAKRSKTHRNNRQQMGGSMRTHKLDPTPLPGNTSVTGVGQTIAPSGGDPFQLNTHQQDEWEILDELQSGESGNEDGNDDANGNFDEEEKEDVNEESEPLNDEEIEKLLEDALLDNQQIEEKEPPKSSGFGDGHEPEVTDDIVSVPHVKRVKLMLKEKGDEDLFGYLPEGWIRLIHFSGMPIFLHRESRVCTFAQPYHIGRASAKKHSVPLRAIPCLFYRKALEEEKLKAQSEASKCPVTGNTTMQDDIKEQSNSTSSSVKSENTSIPSPSQTEIETNPESDKKELELKDENSENISLGDTAPKDGVTEIIKPQQCPFSKRETATDVVEKGTENIDKDCKHEDGNDTAVTSTSDEMLCTDELPTDNKQLDNLKVSTNEVDKMAGNIESSSAYPPLNKTEEKVKGNAESNPDVQMNSPIGRKSTAVKSSLQSPLVDNSAVDSVIQSKNFTSQLRKGLQLDTISAKNPDVTWIELYQYCKHLFEFRATTIRVFRSWKDKRKGRQEIINALKPELPYGAKVIRCKKLVTGEPELANPRGRKKKDRDFILNVQNKSMVCILHEYAQHALKEALVFTCENSGHSLKPFYTTVHIGDMIYGGGLGSSKKNAKLNACKETLRILAPDIYDAVENNQSESTDKYAFFDDLMIEDHRVDEFSMRLGLRHPYDIMLECLKRNAGMGDTTITSSLSMHVGKRKHQFTLSVGKQTVTVLCKNKREGKQLAAQAILQKLHPFVQTWGSLLRLYSSETPCVKPKDDSELTSIAELSGKQKPKKNFSILDKLKEEMLKLQSRRDNIKAGIKGRMQIDICENDSPSVPVIDL